MFTHATTVTRNECGDGVNAVLDALADPGSKCSDEIMRKMFSITFSALKALPMRDCGSTATSRPASCIWRAVTTLPCDRSSTS